MEGAGDDLVRDDLAEQDLEPVLHLSGGLSCQVRPEGEASATGVELARNSKAHATHLVGERAHEQPLRIERAVLDEVGLSAMSRFRIPRPRTTRHVNALVLPEPGPARICRLPR